jgi:RNA-directed DNA polymerase
LRRCRRCSAAAATPNPESVDPIRNCDHRSFGLALHPDKTRLIEFGQLAARRRARRVWASPRRSTSWAYAYLRESKSGRCWLRRITITKRLRAKLREVNDQLKRRRHEPIPGLGQWLASVMRGHFAYYAVPGNTHAVEAFRTQVARHWFKGASAS